MSSIATLLRPNDKSPGDDKLLDLYWNRNELKKAFADLRKEKYRLQDRLKQQDGAIARLQQKLEHLEELLIDSEWARSALVFYQLRGLGMRCQRKLACFAEQLKQQREQRQQNQAMAEWRASLNAELGAVEAELIKTNDSRVKLEDELRALRRKLDDMGGVSRLLRKRSATADIEELTARIEMKERDEGALREKLEATKARKPPQVAGLDIATKRSINLMILAFAQQLHVGFDDDELVDLVKEACEKSAGSIKYGTDSDCDGLLRRIQRCSTAMEKPGDFAGELQRRAKLIGERAVFHSAEDTVPAAGSVETLFRFGASGLVSEGSARLLGDNYWGVAAVLSR